MPPSAGEGAREPPPARRRSDSKGAKGRPRASSKEGRGRRRASSADLGPPAEASHDTVAFTVNDASADMSLGSELPILWPVVSLAQAALSSSPSPCPPLPVDGHVRTASWFLNHSSLRIWGPLPLAEPCRAVTQGRALRGSFPLTRQGPLRTKDFARGRARGTDARARICHAENVDVAYEPANRPGWVQGTYSSLNALISAKFEFSASQLWTSFQGEGASPGGALALSPTAPPTAPRGDTMSLPLPLPRYIHLRRRAPRPAW